MSLLPTKWLVKILRPGIRRLAKAMVAGGKAVQIFAKKGLLAAKGAVVKIGALAVEALQAVAVWMEGRVGDLLDLDSVAKRLGVGLSRAFLQTPDARRASGLMADEIGVAFEGYSLIALAVFLFCLGLVILTSVPLLVRALRRHRARIFVSFQHLLEPVAVKVERALAHSGFRTRRLPFREGASHQEIVMETSREIRKADAVVCLPGRAQSYVEAEVGAATLAFKPVAFLLPRQGGSLPNSADKRYPVFRLEEAEGKGFEPLADFLHYVVADLASGWRQVKEAARHPFLWTTWLGAVGLLWAVLLILFAIAYRQASAATATLAASGPVFAEVRSFTVLVHAGCLVALAALVLGVAGYTLLVVAKIWHQWRAHRRASLKIGTASFTRDDWRQVIPGLEPGSDLYECLFEGAPSAHHEVRVRAVR